MALCHLVSAFFHAQPRPIIIVDDPGRDRAPVDRGDDPFVIVEDHGVVVQAFEPFERGRTPFHRHDRPDQRQEISVGRRDRDFAFPFRLRQIEQGRRQGRLLDHAGVVGQHVFAGENADPIAGGAAVLGRHAGQRRGSDFRQQPLLRQQFELWRILGEENVRRRRPSLLHELAGELGSLPRSEL